jgi:hypothetical protein
VLLIVTYATRCAYGDDGSLGGHRYLTIWSNALGALTTAALAALSRMTQPDDTAMIAAIAGLLGRIQQDR